MLHYYNECKAGVEGLGEPVELTLVFIRFPNSNAREVVRGSTLQWNVSFWDVEMFL